jgi:hypothetical protein
MNTDRCPDHRNGRCAKIVLAALGFYLFKQEATNALSYQLLSACHARRARITLTWNCSSRDKMMRFWQKLITKKNLDVIVACDRKSVAENQMFVGNAATAKMWRRMGKSTINVSELGKSRWEIQGLGVLMTECFCAIEMTAPVLRELSGRPDFRSSTQ